MAGLSASYLEIMNLVYRYPELIDGGDFAGIGELFAQAEIHFEDGPILQGAEAITRSFEENTRRYPDDGTPHTRHVITNPVVHIDDEAGTASCRYYVTVFQRTDDFPLQPVWANRYQDDLVRDADGWRFARRRGFAHLPGDTSHHLLLLTPTDRGRGAVVAGSVRMPQRAEHSNGVGAGP